MLRRPKHALYSAVAVPVASKDTFGATNAILFHFVSFVHRLACSMTAVGDGGEDFCVYMYGKAFHQSEDT